MAFNRIISFAFFSLKIKVKLKFIVATLYKTKKTTKYFNFVTLFGPQMKK